MLKGTEDVVAKEPIHQALVKYSSKHLQSAFHKSNGAAIMKGNFTRFGHDTYVA
jgi:hypothetical protein